MVTIDYAASSEGRPLSDLQGKGRFIEIGKEVIFPGFQEKLLGARKGETVQFSLPFPQQAQDLQEQVPAERLAAFRVTVQDLARKELPTLDDEFAKDHGECDTLAELREKVRTKESRRSFKLTSRSSSSTRAAALGICKRFANSSRFSAALSSS